MTRSAIWENVAPQREWSRREPSDIDGRAGEAETSGRERVNTTTNICIPRSSKRFDSAQDSLRREY